MGLQLNFSEVTTRSFEALPPGWYQSAITDCETRESGDSAKYPGATYIAVEFTIQAGEYDGRKAYTNVNLLPTALFTLKGIMEAVVDQGELNDMQSDSDNVVDMTAELAPDVMDFLQGKEMLIKLSRTPKYNAEKGPDGKFDVDDYRNEVKGFKALGADGIGGAAAEKKANASGNSLLP